MRAVKESGVPFPKKMKATKSKYKFHDLAVGESVLITGRSVTLAKVVGAAYQFGKNNKMKFKSRSVEGGGVRVWRIK
jgi:hypothetical protein